MRLVVMGVSGCGKSTFGEALAKRLGLPFMEGDDFHPPANIVAMSSGTDLTEEMRLPWLRALSRAMTGGFVASCSALKRSYRDILRESGPVFFIHLVLDLPEARYRMTARAGHFMSPHLADAQAALLEPLSFDETGLTLDARLPVRDLVEMALLDIPPPRQSASGPCCDQEVRCGQRV